MHIPSKEIAPVNSKMQYITKSIKIDRLPATKLMPSFNPSHISEIDVCLPEEIPSGISTTNSNTKKATRKVLKSIIKIHCKPNVLRMPELAEIYQLMRPLLIESHQFLHNLFDPPIRLP